MQMTDRELLSRVALRYGAFLERVINGGGVPYSCVIYNGEEVCNAPTSEEPEFISYWENDAYKFWVGRM